MHLSTVLWVEASIFPTNTDDTLAMLTRAELATRSIVATAATLLKCILMPAF